MEISGCRTQCQSLERFKFQAVVHFAETNEVVDAVRSDSLCHGQLLLYNPDRDLGIVARRLLPTEPFAKSLVRTALIRYVISDFVSLDRRRDALVFTLSPFDFRRLLFSQNVTEHYQLTY